MANPDEKDTRFVGFDPDPDDDDDNEDDENGDDDEDVESMLAYAHILLAV